MKLPEKFTYSIEEIAKAWDCTVKDVLQYWIEDKLHLCILIVPPDVGLRVKSDFGTGYSMDEIIEERGHADDELSGAYYIAPSWEKEVNGELYQGRKFELYSDILLTPRHLVDMNGGYDEYFAVLRDDEYVRPLGPAGHLPHREQRVRHGNPPRAPRRRHGAIQTRQGVQHQERAARWHGRRPSF